MAIQVGANCLQREHGGRGVLLGGVPGVEPANVMILGGGVVGTNAAKMAAGMGAHVSILDIDLDRLRYLDDVMPKNVTTVYSNPVEHPHRASRTPTSWSGAVLVEGARAPILVPRSYLKEMKEGSVIVDIAVDQGGCCETTKATTHDNPTYVVDGVVHYGVANMPGAVAADQHVRPHERDAALGPQAGPPGRASGRSSEDAHLRSALNAWKGKITHPGVAEAFGLALQPPTPWPEPLPRRRWPGPRFPRRWPERAAVPAARPGPLRRPAGTGATPCAGA